VIEKVLVVNLVVVDEKFLVVGLYFAASCEMMLGKKPSLLMGEIEL
jgi:hypothetical protein